MPKRQQSPYEALGDGEAMRRAREQSGLADEIALLRVTLLKLIEAQKDEQKQQRLEEQSNDDGGEQDPKARKPKRADRIDPRLVLSVINTLGRAVIAQSRVAGARPDSDAADARLQAALRYFGRVARRRERTRAVRKRGQQARTEDREQVRGDREEGEAHGGLPLPGGED